MTRSLRMKKLVKKERLTVMAAGVALPATVFFERGRQRITASLGKNGLNVRLPALISPKEAAEKMAWAADWAAKTIEAKPLLKEAHRPKTYETGQIMQVGGRRYVLQVEAEDRRTCSAQLAGGTIFLKMPRKTASPSELSKTMKSLLSRVVANDFLPAIERRVNELNHLFFKKEIQKVVLKYNSSNWGSCSTNRIVNLSTRLLFAPDDVIDYIIVHELAHLEEMNHSDRFWALVERAMPNYRAQEKWLKKHGPLLDF